MRLVAHPRLLLPVAALLLALSPAAWADEDPVRVRFEVEPAEVAPGGTATVRAHVTVADGWHVYALDENSEATVPSTFTLAPGAGLSAGAVEAPAATPYEAPYVGTIKIYRGSFTIAQQVRVAPDAAGSPRLQASFGYQACSEGESGVCLPPEQSRADLSLVVTGGGPAPDDGPGLGLGIPGLGDAAADEEPVTVAARLEPAQVRPGDLAEVVLELAMAPTWHIYATETPNGLPTQLELTLPAGLRAVGPLQEPEPHAEEVEFFGAVRYHEGRVVLRQAVAVEEGAAPGPRELTGTLRWQACDPMTCLDGSQALALTLEVDPAAPASAVEAPAGATPTPSGGAAAPTETAGTTPPGEGASASPGEAPQGVLGLVVASIGLGLVMLLMPCTYPMIPITVSIFSKGKTLSRPQAIARAATYAGGIVLSFVAVGGVVQVLAGAKGQGAVSEFAANGWVNLAIGVVFVYFAFSFFGYYELGVPGFVQRLMQLGAARRASDGTVPAWSLFLMGLFFVITSYTCGAPVVLGLFATAAQAPHPMAVLGATFVFGLTVAAPFFFLALVPSAVRLMPKSGSWFSVFKATLAFVELGFAVKFFRGAELQWDAVDLLSRDVTLAIWTILCVCATVYLHGYFPVRFPQDPDLTTHSPRRYAWGWVFLGLAGYFGYGVAGGQLAPSVEAFVLPDNVQGDHPNSVKWGPLSYRTDLAGLEEAKAWARARGKPAFLMFTGHNCLNCAQMEKGVLPEPEVVALLERVPRVALFTDKASDPAEQAHKELMLERYNKSGTIPCFYVIDGEGEIRSAQIGNTSVEGFVEFLTRGGL